MLRRLVPWCAGTAALALQPLGCRTHTQVFVELSTDVECGEFDGATVTVGEPQKLEGKPPVGRADGCDNGAGLHRIGSIVVVPSDEDDAQFGVEVIAGIHGKSPESCTDATGYEDCIIARRAVRFVP